MKRHAIIWPDQTSPAPSVTIMISDQDASESHPDPEQLAAESVNVRRDHDQPGRRPDGGSRAMPDDERSICAGPAVGRTRPAPSR